MIRVIAKQNLVTNAHYIAGFAALRHRVFVERLGWSMPVATTSKGLEYDCFDTQDAVYIVICDENDQVVAGVRLLQTTQPCILADCFPALASGSIPKSETVWEVTRFVVDPEAARAQGGQCLATKLVWALQSFGVGAGLSSFVSVSYAGMERMLRAVGCQFRRLGPPRIVDGRSVVALAFEISEEILARVECRLPVRDTGKPEILPPTPMPLPMPIAAQTRGQTAGERLAA